MLKRLLGLPVITFAIREPKGSGADIGREVLGVRNDEWLAVVLQNFNRGMGITNSSVVERPLHTLVASLFTKLKGVAKLRMLSLPAIERSNMYFKDFRNFKVRTAGCGQIGSDFAELWLVIRRAPAWMFGCKRLLLLCLFHGFVVIHRGLQKEPGTKAGLDARAKAGSALGGEGRSGSGSWT